MEHAPPVDFQLLFDKIPSASVVVLPGEPFTIVAATDAYLQATRSTRQEIIGRGLFDVHPSMRERSSSTPVRSHDGELRYLVHTLESGNEPPALADGQKLIASFELAPVVIALFRGPTFVIEYANPYALQIWGHDRAGVLGVPVRDALPEIADQALTERFMEPVVRNGEVAVQTEQPIRFRPNLTAELDVGYFNFVHVPMRAADGRIEGFIALGWEVTDAVVARRRAEELADHLRVRVEFEQQLIAIVSHDLRNPLSAIRLSADALARAEDLDARATKSVQRIRNATERAIRLVQDLLELSQARLRGSIPVDPHPAELHEIAGGVLDELVAAYPDRKVNLEVEGDTHGEWDADRVAQALQNLATNALKYSPPSSPVQVAIRGGDAEWVSLVVHNEGAPIDPHQLPTIFEPLRRATTSGSGTRSVGLGLFIVKHIAEAHGGSVAVSSTADAGTTFTLRLPRTITRQR